MAMKLTPLFNSAGQLLGHIDLARCQRYLNGQCYILDDKAGRVVPYTDEASETVCFFRFPIKKIRFCGDHDDQVISYLVVDEPIPEWVWKGGGVKFSEDDWERG